MAVIKHLSAENIEYLFGKIARESGIVDSTRSRCYIDNVAQLCDVDFVSEGELKFSQLPQDTDRQEFVVYDNKIHLIGFYNSSSGGQQHYIVDEFGYTKLTNIPYNLYGDGGAYHSAVLNNEIYLLGSNQSSNYKKFYKGNGYVWEQLVDLPYNFYSGFTVVYNNKIHILGGSGSSAAAGHYSWNGSSWDLESTLPFSLAYATASVVSYNNKIYIFCNTNNVNICIWDGTSWSTNTFPEDYQNIIPYRAGKVCVYKNKIHFFQYYSQSSDYSHFTFDGTNWEKIETDNPVLPTPNSAKVYSIIPLGDYIYGFMGNNLYRYDGTGWTNSEPTNIYRKLS